VKHFSTVYQCTTSDEVQSVKRRLYDKKTKIIQHVECEVSATDLGATNTVTSLKGSIEAPKLAPLLENPTIGSKKRLSILVSSEQDVSLTLNDNVDVYYQLPMGLKAELT
ncbi:U32 family peptidase, partial [Vibrio alfacsensis]